LKEALHPAGAGILAVRDTTLLQAALVAQLVPGAYAFADRSRVRVA
jgi:hypothetical protein